MIKNLYCYALQLVGGIAMIGLYEYIKSNWTYIIHHIYAMLEASSIVDDMVMNDHIDIAIGEQKLKGLIVIILFLLVFESPLMLLLHEYITHTHHIILCIAWFMIPLICLSFGAYILFTISILSVPIYAYVFILKKIENVTY